MAQDDLIDFDIIETQKENIQSLPSGRSAKALATLFSPVSKGASSPLTNVTPSHTQNLNDAIRAEYEKELLNIAESDDPLDIYDRYVKWTLDAYPSAQATPQSQLLPLLERATRAFLTSNHYKNDPRYLKLWLHYIRLFSDAPRETFAYLARHNIGDGLALFYEEFAAWLENAGRWTQAEEVYKMGLDREARPAERLLRKFAEFQHRFESRPQTTEEPSSPALPTVRPALAAKVDPFSSHSAPSPSNPTSRAQPAAASSSKPARQKLAIFADSDAPPKPGSSSSTKGWDNIESIRDRKKENTVEARPWQGETLKAGKKNAGVPKMTIFKDQTSSNKILESSQMRNARKTVNERTGRVECVFVDLEAVYAADGEEYCFEELRAKHRGWLDHDWAAMPSSEEQTPPEQLQEERKPVRSPLQGKKIPIHMDAPVSDARSPLQAKKIPVHLDSPSKGKENPAQGKKIPIHVDPSDSENVPPEQAAAAQKAAERRRARREERANRTRKIKVMEVRQEPQTVTTNFDSPTGPKIKRKKNGEATVTIHTKEAIDEIYGIFNQPLQSSQPSVEEESEESSEEEDDDDDDGYTSAGDSTGRISATTSEFGDVTTGDFTTRTVAESDEEESDDESDDGKTGSDWSEFSTSRHVPKDDDTEHVGDGMEDATDGFSRASSEGEVTTPTSPRADPDMPGSKFVPVPPENCDIPPNPYRDPQYVAQSRLPFMTPIVEKTESSLGAATALAKQSYYNSKTPSRENLTTPTKPRSPSQEPWSSPFADVMLDEIVNKKVPQPDLKKAVGKHEAAQPKEAPAPPKGPIIQDTQCNPIDEQIRDVILSQIQPPVSSYEGFFDRSEQVCSKGPEIRKFTKHLAKHKGSNDRTSGNIVMPPVLQFEGSNRAYTVKRELGKGAFAPVYLVESKPANEKSENEIEATEMGKGAFGSQRGHLEAVKMEDPPSVWEFYMLRQAKRRLGVSRAVESIVQAYEMHLFKDECFLIEQFCDQGTLLDLVNLARADKTSGGVIDEQVAMFFTIEIFRTIEALHSKGLLHGDVKADNVLVRFGHNQGEETSSIYRRDGTNGWASKGITLIDFGRGIDMKAFKPDVQFVADWKTSDADCPEMREMRPWTYQIDYYGVAGCVHNLLFGKYIETIAERGASLGSGQTKTYKIRESLKRYWQTEIWSEVFDLMLNPLMHVEGEEGRKLPVLKSMKTCREKMETWLEANCEKGMGLKAMLRRLESAVKDKRR